jgi:TonB family protein
VIGAWMLYASAVGVLLWGCGIVTERLVLRRVPHRLVWAGTLIGSVAIPFGVGHSTTAWLGTGGDSLVVGPVAAVDLAHWPLPGAELEPWLIAGWFLGSLVAAGILFRSASRVRSARAGWREGRVAGMEVLVSRNVGPAVIGAAPARIVIPEWIAEYDERDRRLLLEHEREHVRSGDPYLLLAGWMAVIVLPWSFGIWCQWRRLREAVEVDCDARVLARHPRERRRYLYLLLQVAERVSVRPAGAAMLAASLPPLERRLRILAGAVPGVSGARRLGLAAAALGMTMPLYLLPSPPPPGAAARLTERATEVAAGSMLPVPPAADAPPRLLNRHETPGILERVYPAHLRSAGVGGTVVVGAYVEQRGGVARSAVLESSGYADLDQAALRALEEFRFRPGRSNGRPTPGWAQQPVTFVARQSVQPPVSETADGSATARLALWTAPVAIRIVALR